MLMNGIRAVVLSVVILTSGCGSSEPAVSPEVLVQQVISSQPKQVTPSQVAEVLALGGKSTDIQRELLIKDLLGSVVQWEVQIYEVSLDDGAYLVTTQPFPIEDQSVFNLLRSSIAVVARSDVDHSVLQAAKTGDTITIKGMVQDVAFRGVIAIAPAVLIQKQ